MGFLIKFEKKQTKQAKKKKITTYLKIMSCSIFHFNVLVLSMHNDKASLIKYSSNNHHEFIWKNGKLIVEKIKNGVFFFPTLL